MWFLFQAEDGIRDLVRSRGLGDVYKRQMLMVLETDEVKLLLSTPSRAGILVPTDQEADENLSLIHI